MVLFFLLLGFLGHTDAGWVGQYIRMDTSNCQKLQMHYDRREWSNYKNRYNEASEQLADGDYPPNFLSTSHDVHHEDLPALFSIQHSIQDLVINIGSSSLANPGTITPSCHGIRFATRLGTNHNPHDVLSGIKTSVQYFCFEKNSGFSAVAFQSGRRVPLFSNGGSVFDGDSKRTTSCFEFQTVNSEYIEVYTFQTQNEGQYLMSFMSDPATDWLSSSNIRPSDQIGYLFQPSDGYITTDITSSPVSDKLSVSVAVDGLVDEAKFGEIALTNIQCVNSPMPTKRMVGTQDEHYDWEVAVPGSSNNYLLKIQDGCGIKFRQNAGVRFTSKNVATTICKRPDGTCYQAHPGTASFSTSTQLCDWDVIHNQGGDQLPTGDSSWWDSACCDSLLENYPWTDVMWAWTGSWINGNDDAEMESMVAAGYDVVDAVADRVDDNEVMAMNARAFDDEGDTFTADIFVGDPIEVHFEYGQKCPVLEVSFEFRPSDNNQGKVQEVVTFPIYKRPGIYAAFMPLDTGMTLQQLDNMKYSETSFHDDDGFQDTFIPYHDINFVMGDWAIPNYYLGDDGLNRYSHYKISFRGALRVPNDRTCSFNVPTSSGKVWFRLGGEILIDSDGKAMNQSNSSEIDMGEPTAPVNLGAGEYTYFDLTYVHYGRPFGNEVTQVSLLWDCAGFSMEVIPRKYIFNHGTANGRHGNILTNTDHIDITGLQTVGIPQSKFSLSLEFPRSSAKVVRCTAPDGLVLSPNVITFGPGGHRWSDWPEITIWEEPSFSGNVGPDEAIYCSSENEEKAIYITRTFLPAQKLSLAAAGLYSKFHWHEDSWVTDTSDISQIADSGGEVYTQLLGYKHTSWSCHIQAMHDTVQAGGNTLHPVVGFAFNFGRNVFAAYPTATSAAWKPFFREANTGIPRNERLLITEGEGSLTIKTPNGIECNIKRVGERYMDISCDIPGIIDASSLSSVPLSDNFFKYPTQAQHLRSYTDVPTWDADNLPGDSSFSGFVPTSAISGRNFDLGCIDATAEKQFFDDFDSVDFSSPSVWRTIDRNGGCPLLDDLYPSLQSFSMNFAFGGNIDTAKVTRSIYQHCTMSMYFSKLTSCFSNYYFNQNDARASVKNLLWYSTGTFMDISDMVPQNLRQGYESDGQFCNKDGHLVGSPPQCACIGNGRYPNCDSTVLCGPSTQCQLSALQKSVTGTSTIHPSYLEAQDVFTEPIDHHDSWQSFSMVHTGHPIEKNGVITKWEYMGRSENRVLLQVYRPSGDDYLLFGQNDAPSSVIGEVNVVNVAPEDQITVQPGDLLGWTFFDKAAFGFDWGQPGDSMKWTPSSQVQYIEVGDVYTFKGGNNRRYQVRATILDNDPDHPSKRYCDQEKSIVIDSVTGHAIYCYAGFCTSWESVTRQRGLGLGTNPCETPYCVTAVENEDPPVLPPIDHPSDDATSFSNPDRWCRECNKIDGWTSFSEVFLSHPIKTSGVISGWEYMGGSENKVMLQVYRQHNNNDYQLIGQNDVASSMEGELNIISVSSDEQIHVEAGDYIGWTFFGKAAFGYDNMWSAPQGVDFLTRWTTGSGVQNLEVGVNYPFRVQDQGERRYHVRALINAGETEDVGPVAWYGLTECGTGLVSRDAGRTWASVAVLDDDHCLDSMDCAKQVTGSEQVAEYDNLIWTWSTEEICAEPASIEMKPLKYCVKWFCDCIDAEVWANMI